MPRNDETILRRAALDAVKKQEMMAVLIRNLQAYESAVALLKPRYVRFIGEGLALVWKTVKIFHKKTGELPPRGTLLADIHNACSADDGILTPEELQELDEFLDYAYDDVAHGKNLARSRSHVRTALETCRAYIEECIAGDLRDFANDGLIVVDMAAELDRRKAELDVAGSLTVADIGPAFEEGWLTRDDQSLFTTGISTWDALMGGGWAAGEICLFMAPYGSIKTSLCCHGVAESLRYAAAFYQKAKVADAKAKKPRVVLFFTEGKRKDYQTRLISHLAQVPWKKLASQIHSADDLSRSRTPGSVATEKGIMLGTEYELKEFRNIDEKDFMSEYARVYRYELLCNDHLTLVDCTASNKSGLSIGRGGVAELAGVTRAYFRNNPEYYPLCFWLDHASALVTRYVRAFQGTADPDKLTRRALDELPLDCFDGLANPFNAPMAIFHQFSGEANSRGVTSKFHHTDAKGAKSIGEYTNFAIVGGPLDQNQVCVFTATKHRREPARKSRLVKLDGAFNRVRDVSKHYFIQGNKIVSKKNLDRYVVNEMEERDNGRVAGIDLGETGE